MMLMVSAIVKTVFMVVNTVGEHAVNVGLMPLVCTELTFIFKKASVYHSHNIFLYLPFPTYPSLCLDFCQYNMG